MSGKVLQKSPEVMVSLTLDVLTSNQRHTSEAMNDAFPLLSIEHQSWSVGIMYNAAKMLAYAQWHELLTDNEILSNPQERYDGLLKLADSYQRRGIIDRSERNTLIEIATAAYARSVTDLST